jgi:hypothetical protein
MEKSRLVAALYAADEARPRSQQTAIGVSSLGGCRRQVWHKLRGDEGNNPTKRLAAIMGTAIHAAIEQAFAGTEDVLIEHRVEIDGLPPATIDFYDVAAGEVVDWKTIKLSGVNWFMSKQKQWQVQVYGYLMAKSGYEVKTVTIVGIPRDGDEGDIIVHSEPYDEAIALEALAWLKDVESMEAAPAPERDAGFCKQYCRFYGSLCAGIPKDLSGELITDARATDSAKRYVEINNLISSLESEKDGLKEALTGVTGVTMDGIKVSWSEVRGRETVDIDQVKAMLPIVPMKTGAPTMRLSVK